MQHTLGSLNSNLKQSQGTKISLKYKFGGIHRKRKIPMENLSLETAISQVENLFIIPRGNYKLYLDEELTQELDDQFITNYSQNSDSATVIKIFVKEIVTIE
jgi:hypothetical protein